MLKHAEVTLTEPAIIEGNKEWVTVASILGIEVPPPPPQTIEEKVPPLPPASQSATGLQSHRPAEPQPATLSQNQNVPHSTVTMAGPVQTNVKQGALVGGWVCLGVGILFLLLTGWAFIFYLPLFLAAFVLSIVAMAQRRVAGGIGLLLATLMLPPIAAVGFASMKAGYEKGRELQGGNIAAPKLSLNSWSWSEQHGFAIAEGEVENISSEQLRSVDAVVSFYSADGEFITSAKNLIEFKPLLPGQISPFKVRCIYNPAMKTAKVDFKELLGGTIPWTRKE